MRIGFVLGLLGLLLAVGIARPAAASLTEEQATLQSIGVNDELYYAFTNSSTEESDADRLSATSSSSLARPEVVIVEREGRGRRWWHRNAWWVITLGVAVIITPFTLVTTSYGAAHP